MAIRFIDLCSGIGGFHSGLMATGHYECVGHAEIDKHASQAYAAIYGKEGGMNYGDLRKINPKELPGFDLLCAGFPCQSFSVAGRRLGFQDTRGTVFFEIARIITEKRPPFLLLENVPGLLSHDSGRTLTTIFSSLVEMGYHIEWMVLNSKYFGVPQQRRRLYIIGYLDSRCAGKIFPIGSGNAKNLKQLIPGAQGQRVYETDGVACTQCAGSGGWGGKTGLYFIDMNVDPIITDIARCITARQDSGVSNHRGEHSAVLIEDESPRAMLTPDREKIRQQGRRISPKVGSTVPVAVWDIQPHDEKSLDRYEGYPSHYFKENVTVNLGDEEVSAMVYIMNQKMKFGLPSTDYYNTVLTGYNDCGLDTVALETALKESTQQFYSSAVRQSHQMSFYNFDDEDEDEYLSDDEEPEETEQDINDPFYSFDGMKY